MIGQIELFARRVQDHWYDDRGKIVAVIAVGWSLSIGVRLTYPVLIPHLRVAYDLDLTAAGLLLTVMWTAYAFGQLPSGLLADSIGAGHVMVASTFTAAAMLTLVVIGHTAPILFVATALFGFGTSLFAVGRYAVLSDIYPDKLGTAVGVTSAAGDVGNTVLPPVCGFIAAAIAWQAGFGFVIPLFVVSGVALWFVVPGRTSKATDDGNVLTRDGFFRLVEELQQPTILLITTIQALGTSIWQAFTGFFPTYLIEVKGFSPMLANGLFASFFALGIFVKPSAGNAYDTIGARRSLLIVVGISGLGLVVLPFVEGFWALLGVTVLSSTMLGRGTITLSYITSTLTDEIQNTGFGTLRTSYMTVAAASPVVFGAIAERGFFDEAFLLLGGVTGVMFLLAIRLPDTS